MFRSILPLLAMLAVCVISTGCEKKKTAAQQRAEVEAAWRAKQKGRAAQYYKTLVEKFPDSEYAPKARERLQAIGPVGGTPGEKKPASR